MQQTIAGITSLSFAALFYIEQNYAYTILRSLQAEIRANGGSVHWLLVGNDVDAGYLQADEVSLQNVAAAIALNPAAVFVPGDRVPSFIPGLKVQVFHGLNEDKRGNIYPERGLFDLYCTEGPGRTSMLQPLAEQRGYFQVRETGWLKLDSLFPNEFPNEFKNEFSTEIANEFAHQPALDSEKVVQDNRPIILYASTFTLKLSSAETLYPEIKQLSKIDRWQWLVTLHPKMAAETVEKYQALEGPNLKFIGNDRVLQALHSADIMVSDNSSILQEFLLLNKPVVTFRNRAPQDCMIDFDNPAQLETTIEQALNAGPELEQAIHKYGASITPFLDGKSAARVYQTVIDMFESNWQDKKPPNYWRNWKMRCQLGYFKFFGK